MINSNIGHLQKGFFFVYILLLVVACKQTTTSQPETPTQNQTAMIKKFEWMPTECAPKHYPIEIYQGHFITEDDQYFTVPHGGTVQNGWGSSGSVWAIGEDLKPVPIRLQIIWISYTENQFYYGDFELPQQKMIDFFEKGYTDPRLNKHDTYNNIAVGLAPGGAVSVWLLGGGHTVEIGHYQAQKTEVSMADFNPSGIQDREQYIKSRKKEFSEETKQVLATQGIPIGKWTEYTKRYLWKPKVTHKEKFTLESFSVDFYNGEQYSVQPNDSLFQNHNQYPPPKKITLKWRNKLDYKLGCEIYFDETEIWNAYTSLFTKPENQQAELVFNIDKYNGTIDMQLAGTTDTIPLPKANVKFYTRTQ